MSASSLAEGFAIPHVRAAEDAPRWSLATRIAFRFVFCFFLLSFLPFPLDLIPWVGGAWRKVWTPLVAATGTAVFGVTADATFNGSGDKLFHWIQLFVIVALSVIATLVWSVAQRKAISHPRLHAWFRVYLRFALAVSMISYGAFKVIPSQFVAPSLDRLVQPFGDASPMGLLWTFMGASAAYTIFTGIGELTAGLLLTMRRTVLLGALVTAGVMTHVVMLNFAYDVPVKIYSSQLLLGALVIAAPDARRLFDFFLRTPEGPLFSQRKLRIAAAVLAAVRRRNSRHGDQTVVAAAEDAPRGASQCQSAARRVERRRADRRRRRAPAADHRHHALAPLRRLRQGVGGDPAHGRQPHALRPLVE
jgi:hypothetical protein